MIMPLVACPFLFDIFSILSSIVSQGYILRASHCDLLEIKPGDLMVLERDFE